MEKTTLIVLAVSYAVFVITTTFSYTLCINEGKVIKSIFHTLVITIGMVIILPIVLGIYLGLKMYKIVTD